MTPDPLGLPQVDEATPLPLEYARRLPALPALPAESSWPTGVYACALVWALVTMWGYTAASVPYKGEQRAAWRTQVVLLACAGARLAVARRRREQGRGWAFYLALLLAAPVVWALISPALGALGGRLWGGALIP